MAIRRISKEIVPDNEPGRRIVRAVLDRVELSGKVHNVGRAFVD